MTADVVNLRRTRKQMARRKAETEAAHNRAAFGRSKVELDMTTLDKAREAKRLDGHQREAPKSRRPSGSDA